MGQTHQDPVQGGGFLLSSLPSLTLLTEVSGKFSGSLHFIDGFEEDNYVNALMILAE